MRHIPRFYCPHILLGKEFSTPFVLTVPQHHHLLAVLRRRVGDELFFFNPIIGEYRAKIIAVEKKMARLKTLCQEKKPCPATTPTRYLFMALLETSRLDILIPKAVELGVDTITPIITDFTDRKKTAWQKTKWQRVAISASEQSGRLTTPILADAIALTELNIFTKAPYHLPIIYGDETGGAGFYPTLTHILKKKTHQAQPIGILVGPTGGFSHQERNWLNKQDNFYRTTLGKRILRSETAAIAMLAGVLFYENL
ncbi:MAG: RsmE family RNA methyltransferase [Alphaproteobacteria bacterium]